MAASTRPFEVKRGEWCRGRTDVFWDDSETASLKASIQWGAKSLNTLLFIDKHIYLIKLLLFSLLFVLNLPTIHFL